MHPADLNVGDRAHELAAVVALLKKQLVAPYRLAVLVEEYGSAVHIAQLSEVDRLFAHDNPAHDFVGAVTSEDITNALIEVREWLKADRDVRSVLEEDYPPALRTIFNRPPLLFFLGNWDQEAYARSVAIVGTRTASEAGKKRAGRLSRELVEADFTVFSGLAAGIDTAAHRAALAANGRTVAVMGTGIDRRYPKENASLADEIIASGGCLVSQFFPNQHPASWTFPNRNVVMSGLSLATVVVEAAETSGAKMQARVALQHGRTVFILHSLVESHTWARKYVEEGVYDTKAIAITSTHEIVSRLNANVYEELQT